VIDVEKFDRFWIAKKPFKAILKETFNRITKSFCFIHFCFFLGPIQFTPRGRVGLVITYQCHSKQKVKKENLLLLFA
jgi:hypothetical protein